MGQQGKVMMHVFGNLFPYKKLHSGKTDRMTKIKPDRQRNGRTDRYLRYCSKDNIEEGVSQRRIDILNIKRRHRDIKKW